MTCKAPKVFTFFSLFPKKLLEDMVQLIIKKMTVALGNRNHIQESPEGFLGRWCMEVCKYRIQESDQS